MTRNVWVREWERLAAMERAAYRKALHLEKVLSEMDGACARTERRFREAWEAAAAAEAARVAFEAERHGLNCLVAVL